MIFKCEYFQQTQIRIKYQRALPSSQEIHIHISRIKIQHNKIYTAYIFSAKYVI